MSDRANRIVLRSGFASLCSTIVSVAGSALVAAIVTVPWGPNSFVFVAAFVVLAVPLVLRGCGIRLVIDDEGVQVANFFRTSHFVWDDIAAIGVGKLWFPTPKKNCLTFFVPAVEDRSSRRTPISATLTSDIAFDFDGGSRSSDRLDALRAAFETKAVTFTATRDRLGPTRHVDKRKPRDAMEPN
jgi:Bacterial PH domain